MTDHRESSTNPTKNQFIEKLLIEWRILCCIIYIHALDRCFVILSATAWEICEKDSTSLSEILWAILFICLVVLLQFFSYSCCMFVIVSVMALSSHFFYYFICYSYGIVSLKANLIHPYKWYNVRLNGALFDAVLSIYHVNWQCRS